MTEKINRAEWEEFQKFKTEKAKRTDKVVPQEEKQIEFEEVEQEEVKFNDDNNFCNECKNKISGRPDKCPSCNVELDWS